MNAKNLYEPFPQEDYIQSANTLFNFMKEPDFLYKILKKKAIAPRYCREDIRYLNLSLEQKQVERVYVLQKCFCDIPLHKILDNFEVISDEELSREELFELKKHNTHPDYYGKFGIGFSKVWCETRGLQPVQYMNEKSDFVYRLSELLGQVLEAEDVPEAYADEMLRRLAFIKPLRGVMERVFETNHSKIRTYKNFHDEKEWRYVPDDRILKKANKQAVVGNNFFDGLYITISNELEADEYSDLWLKYDYTDIRYLIVPNLQSRIDLIKVIRDLPLENFVDNTDLEKDILISKILVLDEIRKDW